MTILATPRHEAAEFLKNECISKLSLSPLNVTLPVPAAIVRALKQTYCTKYTNPVGTHLCTIMNNSPCRHASLYNNE